MKLYPVILSNPRCTLEQRKRLQEIIAWASQSFSALVRGWIDDAHVKMTREKEKK